MNKFVCDLNQNIMNYSDDLWAILMLAFDYNQRPTQRDIIDDRRLPAHLTYVRKYGSIWNALVLVGLQHMPLNQSPIPPFIERFLKEGGFEFSQNVSINDIVVDFKVSVDGRVYLIDVIDGIHANISDNYTQQIRELRADILGPHALWPNTLLQISNPSDMQWSLFENVQLKHNEEV